MVTCLKGVGGRGIQKQCIVVCCREKEELIGKSGSAKEEQKFGDTEGVMAVLRAHGERLSQACSVYPITDARSHSHCCRDKK